MIILKFRIKKYLPLLFTIFISTIFLSNCVGSPKKSILLDDFCDQTYYPFYEREIDLRKYLDECKNENHYLYLKAHYASLPGIPFAVSIGILFRPTHTRNALIMFLINFVPTTLH